MNIFSPATEMVQALAALQKRFEGFRPVPSEEWRVMTNGPAIPTRNWTAWLDANKEIDRSFMWGLVCWGDALARCVDVTLVETDPLLQGCMAEWLRRALGVCDWRRLAA